MGKVVRSAAIASVAIGAILGTTATPASAIPFRCSYWGAGYSEAGARCEAGTGQFRAIAYCKRENGGGVSFEYYYGPWRYTQPGSLSTVSCPRYWYVLTPSVGLRN